MDVIPSAAAAEEPAVSCSATATYWRLR